MNSYSDKKYNYTAMTRSKQMNNNNNYSYDINPIREKDI